MGDHAICGYCGKPELTGLEDEEHILPRAINARLITRNVSTECNRWAGKHVDKPWLGDPFVAETRYTFAIPDRHGNVLEHDPFLAGVTPEGIRIKAGRDGAVQALNSHVVEDSDTGTVHITAPDQKALDAILKRHRKRAEAAGLPFTIGEPQAISSQPQVTVEGKLYPGQWERMAAKAVLGLLSETQPAVWRQSVSADGLRQRMRRLERPANQVELHDTTASDAFAAKPASVLAVCELDGQTFAQVSLMGTFGLTWQLDETIPGIDLVWVSDPVDPGKSVMGRLMDVIAARCAE